jgi:hypothetical protein
VTGIPRDAYTAAANAIVETADATLGADAVQLAAAVLAAVQPYFASERAAAAAAETERIRRLAVEVGATFRSTYSFTEGRSKILRFADYLEDVPAARQDADVQARPAASDGRAETGSFADTMFPPAVREQLAASAAAFRCPNDPPCQHGGLVHEFDHPVPRCVEDDCPCGAAASPEGSTGR